MNINEWPLSLFSLVSKYDYRESILWNVECTKFYVTCSDIFFWACADAEHITEEDLDDFEQALKESYVYGGALWCARKRKMRPQKVIYHDLSEEEKVLFNKCGPERND